MDHNAEFHQRCIDRSTAGIDDVDIVLSNGLCYADICLSYAALGDFCLGKSETYANIENFIQMPRERKLAQDIPTSDDLCELWMTCAYKKNEKLA